MHSRCHLQEQKTGAAASPSQPEWSGSESRFFRAWGGSSRAPRLRARALAARLSPPRRRSGNDSTLAQAYRAAPAFTSSRARRPEGQLGLWSGGAVAARAAGKMPVAVMADSAFSFRKLLDQCENQELEVARQGGAVEWAPSPG